MSVLERIAQYTENDIQRVGLSATVRNPEAILRWLTGSSKREGRVVDPPNKPVSRKLAVTLCPSTADIAAAASVASAGKKSLFFCESRSLTEAVAQRMRARDTEVFVHHSSLSKEERVEAEKRVLEAFGTALHLHCWIVRHLIEAAPDMSKPSRGNHVWDYLITFSTSPGATIKDVPLWLITADKAILMAAKNAGAASTFRALREYRALLEDSNALVAAIRPAAVRPW